MKIRFRLSESGVREAIKKTRDQAKAMQFLCDRFACYLAEAGAKAAQNAVNAYGARDTGDLIGNITFAPVAPGVYKVSCYVPVDTSDGVKNYAWFVEYGTGIKGKGSRHPEYSLVGWTYDKNGHGEDGWFYPYGKSQKHKYKFNPATEKMQPWTDGEPAKPFMYDSRQYIQQDAVVQDAFKKAVSDTEARFSL